MKKIKVCYSSINNMGDILNKQVIEKCFNCKVVRRSSITANVSGIGSGLATYRFGENKISNMIKKICGIFIPNAYIWGTGFITYDNSQKKFFKKNIKFCAVRGELTKKRVEEITGKKLNIPTGDGGILASYLLEKKPKVKYEVGIIPHFREKNNILFKKLADNFDSALIIDVQDDPINVINKIAQCKVIISSSLHGLIIADSLRIPNVHVTATDNLLGDGFKFDDYYSAYGLKHEFIDLNKSTIKDINSIIKSYKVSDKMVNEMKQNMLNSFPYKN